MRVNTPCRSIQCPHAQCFDATSWFAMMEQTTTWLCPVCDKVLNVEELIIDGFAFLFLFNFFANAKVANVAISIGS